jgi:uncharacterized membrane protein
VSIKIEKVLWPWILLVVILTVIVSLYVSQFYNFKWSEKPGDWGAIGDYLGGILNPLVSSIALFFLIKAYISQKEELAETRSVLEKTEINSKDLAESQKSLVAMQIEQSKTSQSLMKTQYVTSQINSHYKRVTFLQNELVRCTEAIVNNRNSVDYEGISLNTEQETKNYRSHLISEMKSINFTISKLNSELESVNT